MTRQSRIDGMKPKTHSHLARTQIQIHAQIHVKDNLKIGPATANLHLQIHAPATLATQTNHYPHALKLVALVPTTTHPVAALAILPSSLVTIGMMRMSGIN